MRIRYAFMIATIVCCGMACKTSKTAEPESKLSKEDQMYADFGTEMCGCMKGILEMAEVMEESEPDDMALYMAQMQEEAAKVQVCVEDLKKKYPEIDMEAQSNPRAEKALMDNCPQFQEMAEKNKASGGG